MKKSSENQPKHRASVAFVGPTFDEVAGPGQKAPQPKASKAKVIVPSNGPVIIPVPQTEPSAQRNLIREIEEAMPSLYHDYKKLVTPSEVPEEFHVFAFMTMMSALAGDKVHFVEGTDILYPNIWTMLVGESSVSRKSTAFRPVLQTLKNTKCVNLLPAKGSPEGLFKDLADHGGVGLFSHSELGTLLGAMQRDYMSGLPDELCEYYDPCSTGLMKRLSQEEIHVDHLSISWIAATTPHSLEECEAYDRIASGFLPRWNIVLGGPPNHLLPFRPAVPVAELAAYAEKLVKLIPKEITQIKFGPAARQLFVSWYAAHRPKVPTGPIGYFHTRILEVVKKYAVLVSFAHGRSQVEGDDMALAIKAGEYFMVTADQLITKVIAENRDEKYMRKIKDAIRHLKAQKRPRDARNLYRAVHLKKRQFDEYAETLTARGEIEVTNGQFRLTES